MVVVAGAQSKKDRQKRWQLQAKQNLFIVTGFQQIYASNCFDRQPLGSKQVDLSFSPKNLSGQILQVLIFGKNVVNFFTCGFFAHTSDSGLILRLQDMSPQFFLKFAKQAPLFVIFFTPYAKECYFFTVGRFQ